MSADCWRPCPKCLKRETRRMEMQAVGPQPQADTLREDFEIGMRRDGRFYISYACHCSECGFEFKHEFGKQVV